MAQSNKILLLLVAVLILSTGFFAYKYYGGVQEMKALANTMAARQYNEKATQFLQMFVKRVIKADKEVDFDTRLQLENAVRDLKDQAILGEWQAFVGSNTESEAQLHTKNLLDLLADRACTK